MYLGQYRLSLNNDQQIHIPEQFRSLFMEGAYVTRGFEENLLIMSAGVFQELYKRAVALNIADPIARLLLRLIIGNASRLDLNQSGNILIPDNLSASAGLENEIVLVGQGNYLELWAPTDWEKQTTNLRDTEANATRFAQLDLALQ